MKFPFLKILATLTMLAVGLPLFTGFGHILRVAARLAPWQQLFGNPQFFPALKATFCSALIANITALLICLLITAGFYPGQRWQRLQQRLTFFLALPHIAFAVGLFFLLMPSGIPVRLLHALGFNWRQYWPDIRDARGIGLGLILGIRESWFLLWVAAAQLQQQTTAAQLLLMRSLGYGKLQAFVLIVMPVLLPRLKWALTATVAYSVAVVDVALTVGPGNPPTLAVLAWQWLNHTDPELRAAGMAATLLLVLTAVILIGVAGLLWQGMRRLLFPYSGRRILWQGQRSAAVINTGLNGSAYAVVLILLLWSLAGAWFYPALLPQSWTISAWQQADGAILRTTFYLGGSATLIGLLSVMLWLDASMARFNRRIWLPLLLPALPAVIGQYDILLRLHLDATFIGVVWTHLLWVVPYMLLILAPAYQRTDPRLIICARSLGISGVRLALLIRWPLLLRPILAACAVGFSVSVAQYLPTLYSGAGRFATVTTQAVALSGGGNMRVQAVQAFLQWLLPALIFAGAALLSTAISYKRRGLS